MLKRMWMYGVALAALVAVLCLAQPASAQMAKSGKFTGQFGWYGVGTVFPLEENHIYWVGEFTGTFFNDAGSGFLHRSSVKCPAWQNVKDGQSTAAGWCIMTDKDGDQIVADWSCKGTYPACDGPFEWKSGTGKYKGISGKSTFTSSSATATEGYAVWDANYKLP